MKLATVIVAATALLGLSASMAQAHGRYHHHHHVTHHHHHMR